MERLQVGQVVRPSPRDRDDVIDFPAKPSGLSVFSSEDCCTADVCLGSRNKGLGWLRLGPDLVDDTMVERTAPPRRIWIPPRV